MVHMLMSLALMLALAPQQDNEVGTGPAPSPNPISWELEFKFLDPRRLEVLLPGHDQPEVYWYMVYTAVNRSPRSQRFFPMFQIVTEDLQVFDTDTGISPLVFDTIRERHKITHKYLESPTKVIGALLSGDDNARESVAIWRQIDLNVNEFKVYVAGLSGEMRFVSNPLHDPERPETETITGPDGRPRTITMNPKHFTLRKTLEIRYTLPGSPKTRPGAAPERRRVRWIMR